MKRTIKMPLLLCLFLISGLAVAVGQIPSPAVDVNTSIDIIQHQDTPPVPFGSDCGAAPGRIITDDGSIENGYSGNPLFVTKVSIVEGFSLTTPGKLVQVCVAFITQGPTSMDFEVIILADDGPGGTPGTILGTLNATATDIPIATSVPYTKVWQQVDLSSLNLTLYPGTVYIGARWIPSDPNVFLSADESGTTPIVPSYIFFAGSETEWQTTQSSFASYKSMFIRPQFEPASIHVPFAKWSILAGIVLIFTFAVVRFHRLF